MRKLCDFFCFNAASQWSCLPTAAAGAQTRDIGVHGELLDRIAAIVNDGLVLKSELDAQMDAVTKRLQEQKVELPSQSVLKQQVLDRLILQEIQAQHAKRVGLTVSDEQLNSALQEIASRNKIPFDQLPTALAAQGVDYKQYRESMRKELTLSTLRQRDVIAHINVIAARAGTISGAPAEPRPRTTSSTYRTFCCRCRKPPRRNSSRRSPTRRRILPRAPPRARTSASSRSRTRTARRHSTAAARLAKGTSCRSSFWNSSPR